MAFDVYDPGAVLTHHNPNPFFNTMRQAPLSILQWIISLNSHINPMKILPFSPSY